MTQREYGEGLGRFIERLYDVERELREDIGIKNAEIKRLKEANEKLIKSLENIGMTVGLERGEWLQHLRDVSPEEYKGFYDWHQAERAKEYAAKLAADATKKK